jgi:RHH-type transcriptional regulator, proline utilization regulon repressor / proline dehydrogenase / delta 1-pyrroline-5-carboxylate dehydrogenase
MSIPAPFSQFDRGLAPQSALRAAITRHYRASEPDCVAELVLGATLSGEMAGRARLTAAALVQALRAKGSRGPVECLVREYDLSSQEGAALMCLAEALLRIPDTATRDALIRDKISTGDWRGHVGHSTSLFVNAATWGLVVTGKLVGTANETGLGAALTRLIARGGEPVIRRGVELAMRMMGEQFVTGQTIAEALRNASRLEAKGFRYSYDMLGEAAVTAADATRYYREYEAAIHAIGRAAAGRGLYEGPGISIKLSALHPRYSRAQRDRVMAELPPRLTALAVLCRRYDIGLNIDAEEADRLELSLGLLEALCFEAVLAGWNGIGFVVQAYQKRAPFVLDWIIDLGRRSTHRLMIRLVKGAYWDSEIKRAQVDGLAGFPVFTRKIHTDISYLACAAKLLAVPDVVFPQFATHNAQTLAAIYTMAGEGFHLGQYEFQCLHGMSEPLYEEVVGPNKLGRPCRIYAPVGTHETLLAYLVRRLLENGANSSFVNRIQDPAVSVEDLVADPVKQAGLGTPHERIALPRDLFAPGRTNSTGLDLSNDQILAGIAVTLRESAETEWSAAPTLNGNALAQEVRNPADRRDLVGHVVEATSAQVDTALKRATEATRSWAATPPAARSACLMRAADRLEETMPALLGLIIREAGKSLANAVAEVREAVDFLRYYAEQGRVLHAADCTPLGVVTCISPWNFPLAIFTGQVAAALAAGNCVLAKPAEETPLIAAQAVALLHEAGVPLDVLQLLPGQGEVGAQLVADARTCGVVFTGSTAVAKQIQGVLALRLNPDGTPVPLIAETGGQNAMVVDSSALTEQVVADVLVSAFDSAGQRCSALRVLCLQEEIGDRTLAMLLGAMAELSIGNPDRLSVDIGPVITDEAQADITGHIQEMRAARCAVHQMPLPADCERGTFVAPTIIEIPNLAMLKREVFGPVLHVLRYARDGLDDLIAEINATGFALTFGLHTRIDETVTHVTARVGAGNIYVNRNLIGAVVGVQPFGGHGLSGTGPKAGGPLYLRRLLVQRPAEAVLGLGSEQVLPGPVGERNIYRTEACGTVLCIAPDRATLQQQIAAVRATGNQALVTSGLWTDLPAGVRTTSDPTRADFDAVLFAGGPKALLTLNRQIAERPGLIVAVHVRGPDGTYPLEFLVQERSVSTNTTAAGGNANLTMIA